MCFLQCFLVLQNEGRRFGSNAWDFKELPLWCVENGFNASTIAYQTFGGDGSNARQLSEGDLMQLFSMVQSIGILCFLILDMVW